MLSYSSAGVSWQKEHVRAPWSRGVKAKCNIHVSDEKNVKSER